MGGEGGGGVVIESEVWVPNQAIYIFIILSCIASIFGRSHLNSKTHSSSSSSSGSLDQSLPPSLRTFLLLLFSISSGLSLSIFFFFLTNACFQHFQLSFFVIVCVINEAVLQGLGSMAGDYFSYSSSGGGFSKDHLALSISVAYAASLFLAPLAGILSDFMYSLLHPFSLYFLYFHMFIPIFNSNLSFLFHVMASTYCLISFLFTQRSKACLFSILCPPPLCRYI